MNVAGCSAARAAARVGETIRRCSAGKSRLPWLRRRYS
jgi:hypothetical protein